MFSPWKERRKDGKNNGEGSKEEATVTLCAVPKDLEA